MLTNPITIRNPWQSSKRPLHYIMLGKMALAYEAIISEESNLEGLKRKEAQLGLQAGVKTYEKVD